MVLGAGSLASGGGEDLGWIFEMSFFMLGGS